MIKKKIRPGLFSGRNAILTGPVSTSVRIYNVLEK